MDTFRHLFDSPDEWPDLKSIHEAMADNAVKVIEIMSEDYGKPYVFMEKKGPHFKMTFTWDTYTTKEQE